jgi:hypothetical protein
MWQEVPMEWPFKTISKESSWPFQGRLILLATEVLSAGKEDRQAAAAKTIERTLRMAARLAREFGFPACAFMHIAKEQLIRENPDAKAHLAMHAEHEAHEMTDAVAGTESLVDSWLAEAAKTEGDKPN